MNYRMIIIESKKLNKSYYGKYFLLSAMPLFIIISSIIAFRFLNEMVVFEKTFIFQNKSIPVFIMTLVLLIIIKIVKSVHLIGFTAYCTGNVNNKIKRYLLWVKIRYSAKAVALCTVKSALSIFWTFIFSLPSIFIGTSILCILGTDGVDQYFLFVLIISFVIITFFGFLISFVFLQRYFLVDYLFAMNPKLTVIQAIKQSINLMNGQLQYAVFYKLRYIPRMFLSVFIIPAFYFYPNYKQGCFILAKQMTI